MPSGPRLREGGADGQDVRRHRLLPLRPGRRDRRRRRARAADGGPLHAAQGQVRRSPAARATAPRPTSRTSGWSRSRAAGRSTSAAPPARPCARATCSRPSTTSEEAIRLALVFLQHYRENGDYLERTYGYIERVGHRRGPRGRARPGAAGGAARALPDRQGGGRPRPVARAPRPGGPTAVRRARPGDADRRGARGGGPMIRIGRADRRPDARGPQRRCVGGRRVAVFRTPDGFRAIDHACPHAGGPLADGIVADRCVTCPLHGWRFDLEHRPGAERRRRRSPSTRSSSATASCGSRSPRRCPRRHEARPHHVPVLRGRLRPGRRGRPRPAQRGRRRPAAPGQPRRDVPQAAAPARRRPRARPRDDAARARVARRALAAVDVAQHDPDAGAAAARDRRRARPRRDRVLRLGAAADRGLLRRQQAREGLPRHEQRRLELAAVHVERGRGLPRGAGLRRAAAGVRRPRPDRLHAAARDEHRRVPPRPVGADPPPPGRGRVSSSSPTRAAPNRGGRRPPPAGAARRATCRCSTRCSTCSRATA